VRFGSLKANANDRDHKLVYCTAFWDARAIIITIAFARLILCYAISTVCFGRHWDEGKIIEGVQITSSVLLPGVSNWPSLTYLVARFTPLANLPASSRQTASRLRGSANTLRLASGGDFTVRGLDT
jgi:hypothetical protein